ncbi:MAG: hypothetical protein J7K08_04865 [Thermoplasmata archaeon]|nr:hypothetical protein [Thermoplasmata archaeon]
MKKGKLALGRGLKELLPTALKEVGGEEAGLEELLEELKKVKERVEVLGYPTEGIDEFLKREKFTEEEVRDELERWRSHLVSLTRLETVLRQMESLKMTSQVVSYRGRVSAGEEPEVVLAKAEKELKKAVLKRSRKRIPEDEISEVRKMIEESKESLQKEGAEEHLEEAKEEAVKKIEELSRSLEELTKLMGVEGEEEALKEEEGRVEEEEKAPKGPPPEEERMKRFLKEVHRLKEEGFFVGEIEIVYDEKGIDEAERELEEFRKRAERMKEIRKELDSMDLSGVEREASLIRIKLKYPNLLEEVEEDLKRLKDLLSKGGAVGEVKKHRAEEESVDALLARAKKLYIAGELQQAKELFEKVLELAPENPTAKFMLRRINMRL